MAALSLSEKEKLVEFNVKNIVIVQYEHWRPLVCNQIDTGTT